MKRIFAAVLLICACISIYAQKDVTKFLGIPVDGPKSEVIRKLKAKGFKTAAEGLLSGIFNGQPVSLSVVSEKGKVCRIAVFDANPVNETEIKIRFNSLCHQFENNGKYLLLDDFSISDSEDIAFEMSVHNKRYEAVFLQLPERETLETFSKTRSRIAAKYSSKDWWNPTDDKLMNEILNEEIGKAVRHKSVWFMINEFYGKYYISMYYDNELNRAQGEDL